MLPNVFLEAFLLFQPWELKVFFRARPSGAAQHCYPHPADSLLPASPGTAAPAIHILLKTAPSAFQVHWPHEFWRSAAGSLREG